ncbi:23S rRNA (guanosine-2'-O-)-methyltransferase RlmB [uncultured archaeon]|nr:23S rRNA (guanosine-2'-O-)-methyltransferase RlmB [uncultured archaeon]
MLSSNPKFRFILVRTEYEMNLGSAARLMANFGQSPLYLVKPDCMVGFTAKMYAKHATNLLEKAVVCDTLAQATRGCSLVVGTTGVLRRHKDALRHPLMLDEFREKIYGQRHKAGSPIAIVFGAEGNGLTEAELKACDTLITIPTVHKYPVMNLSHSFSTVLYALCGQQKKISHIREAATEGEKKALMQTFERIISHYRSRLREPDKIELAFKRVMGRAMPDKVETNGMLIVLRQALKELEHSK